MGVACSMLGINYYLEDIGIDDMIIADASSRNGE